MNQKPPVPKLAHWLFRLYCAPYLYEEMHGDLEEFYYERVELKGLFKGKLFYWWNVIRCCQPYAWRPLPKSQISNIMLKSNIKVAYRSLKRNKVHASINVLGLAIGIAFSCMLYLYVSQELTYDQYHEKSDRLYRVLLLDERNPDQPRTFGSTPPPIGPALTEDMPEIENAARLFRPSGQVVFSVDNRNFQERDWFIVDQSLFEMMDFEVIDGDLSTALTEPNTAVITESAAIKYFGTPDVVGRELERGQNNGKITAVIRDLPANSHLQFAILVSNVNSDEGWQRYLSNWQTFGASTYVLLKEGTSIDQLRTKKDEFEKLRFGPFAAVFSIDFQGIEDIYMKSANIEFGVEESQGKMDYIYIFTSMGLFMLLIACINYLNLATATAVFRVREIGIRKAIGAYKKQLRGQFLTESFMITLLAMLFAIGIMDLTFPFFNGITGTQFDITFGTLLEYVPMIAGLSLLIGLLAGSYPAFYLSSFRPIQALRNQTSGGSAFLRKGLVIFQFVLTIVMIVSTLVVQNQLNFVRELDMGFDKERLLVIDINSGNVRAQFQTMKNEFEQISGVESVGVSSRVPGEWKNITTAYFRDVNSDPNDSLRSYFMGFDEDMLKTFKFELVAGDYFGNNQVVDSTGILLNETAAKALGLENPVGSSIIASTGQGKVRTRVVGVLKDFHFQSLHEKVAPLVIGAWNNPIRVIDYFTLKVAGDMSEVIAAADVVHKKFDDRSPMEYHVLTDQLEIFYEEEKKAGMIFQMGAGLSIFVACLGLFALASFTASKRKKEMGIRKILGADHAGLFLLLSSTFAKQVGIAFLIASPLAFYMMNNWLDAFEYHVSLGVGTFLLAGIMAFTVALLTVSYRSIRVIKSNPVESIRQE
ncbi:MAG: ABC transporter permease [Cytophagales bacterium]|nr:ABC transporter permease [Cytophagales bacterium]